MEAKGKSLLDRFEAKICPEPNTGCWLWLGALDPKGYGSFGVDRKTRRAHRFAYELYLGPIPQGKELDHKCRVRYCVNPRHLEPVDHRENIMRGENSTKTHCPHGHIYAGDNLYVYRGKKEGHRKCRRCQRLGKKKIRERRKNHE